MKVVAQVKPEVVEKFVGTQDWSYAFMADYVDRWEQERPDHLAFVGGSPGSSKIVTLTWRQVAEQSRSLARGLAEMGVGLGDVVSVQLPNVLEFALLHIATVRMGAAFNPIHMAYRQAEIEGVVTHSESKVLVCVGSYKGFDYLEMVRGMRQRLPTVEQVVVVGAEGGGDTRTYASLLEASGDLQPAFPPLPDTAPLSLFYTSGTTGDPKGVVHTHFAPLSNAGHCLDTWKMGPQTVLMTLAPYSFAFGAWAIYCSVSRGITQVLMETFEPDRFCQQVQANRVSLVYMSPAHALALSNMSSLQNYDLSSVDAILFSGTSVPAAMVTKMPELLGGKVLILWGMTECYGTLLTRPDDELDIVSRTVGRAERGCEVAILDADGNEAPRGEVGELAQRGANLFTHYHKSPHLLEEAFTEQGWFRSGDLATMDQAGNVTIVSRVKDMINRGGTKIYPAEVEMLLHEHPKIQAAAIVAMPDERLGEKACLYAVTREVSELTLGEVTAFLDERGIAKYKYPERVEVLDALPLNPSNKVDKIALRRMAAEGDAATR